MSYRKRSTRDITRATEAASDAAARGASVDIERPPPRSMLIGSSLSRHGALSTTNIATSTEWKGSCRVATTTNITLENEQTIDDVAVVDGDRVLVKDQTDATTNGIYVCKDAAAWVRAEDCDDDAEALNFSCFVREGMTNANNQFVCTNDTVTLGTTELVIILYGAGGALGLGDISDVTLTDPIAVTEGTRKYIKYDASLEPPQWVDEDFPFTDEQITTFTTLTGVLSATTVDDATTLTISSALTVTGTSLLEGAMIVGTAATGADGTSVLTVRGSGHVLGSFVVGQKLSTASSMEVARELKIGTRLPTTADHYIANAPGVFYLDGDSNVRVFSGTGTDSVRNLSDIGTLSSPVTVALTFNEAITMAKKLTISGGGFDVTGTSQFHDTVNIGSGGRIGQVLRDLHVNGKLFVGHATYTVDPTETAITAQGGIVCSSINSSGLLHCGSLSVDTTGTVTGISMENLGVVVTNPRSGNEILKYDGTNWNAVRNQLSALGDVDAGGTLPASSDGYVLTYVHAADPDAKWQAKQIVLPNNVDVIVGRASPASGNKNLIVHGSATIGAALHDVTPITTSFAVAHGNATFAKNVTVTETMKTKNLTVNATGTVSGIGVSDLDLVTITGPQGSNEWLRYNGTNWVNTTNKLTNIGDVSAAGAMAKDGYVLTYVHAGATTAKWQLKKIALPDDINVTIGKAGPGGTGIGASAGYRNLQIHGNLNISPYGYGASNRALWVQVGESKFSGNVAVGGDLTVTGALSLGQTTLNSLNDVVIASGPLPAEGEILYKVNIQGQADKWRNVSHKLNRIGDVNAPPSAGINGHVLTYVHGAANTAKWQAKAITIPNNVNITIGQSGTLATTYKTLTVYGNIIVDATAKRTADSNYVALKVSNGNVEFANKLTVTGTLVAPASFTLTNLGDVTIGSGASPSGGDLLVRTSSNNWGRQSHTIANVGDVTLTSPKVGQALVRTSTGWKNGTVSAEVPSTITKDITIGTAGVFSRDTNDLDIFGRLRVRTSALTSAIEDYIVFDVGRGKANFAGNVSISGTLTVGGTAISGAGATSINDLSDVNVGVGASPSGGDMLLRTGSGHWLRTSHILNRIGDVTILNPADGHALVYDSGTWKNKAVSAGTLTGTIAGNRTYTGTVTLSGGTTFTNTVGFGDGISITGLELNDLADVTIGSGAYPAGGDLLIKTNSGNWGRQSHTVANIGDVSLSSPQAGHALVRNSSNNGWTNAAISATGTALSLNDLTDVTIASGASPAGGEILLRTGANNFVKTSHVLNRIGDVTITSPSDGQVLLRSGSGWVNGSPTVSTTIANLALITDVPGPIAGRFLKRNDAGNAYEWAAGPTGATVANLDSITDVPTNHGADQILARNGSDNGYVWIDLPAAGGGASELNDLSDVTIASGASPAGGEILLRTGANNFVKTSHVLNRIGDVVISSPGNGQALIYNSGDGEWKNGTVTATFDHELDADLDADHFKMTDLRRLEFSTTTNSNDDSGQAESYISGGLGNMYFQIGFGDSYQFRRKKLLDADNDESTGIATLHDSGTLQLAGRLYLNGAGNINTNGAVYVNPVDGTVIIHSKGNKYSFNGATGNVSLGGAGGGTTPPPTETFTPLTSGQRGAFWIPIEQRTTTTRPTVAQLDPDHNKPVGSMIISAPSGTVASNTGNQIYLCWKSQGTAFGSTHEAWIGFPFSTAAISGATQSNTGKRFSVLPYEARRCIVRTSDAGSPEPDEARWPDALGSWGLHQETDDFDDASMAVREAVGSRGLRFHENTSDYGTTLGTVSPVGTATSLPLTMKLYTSSATTASSIEAVAGVDDGYCCFQTTANRLLVKVNGYWFGITFADT